MSSIREHQPTAASDDLVVIAPDGIAVHPIPLPGLLGLTLAEGRLPVGQFGVHAHRTLEQVTYMLSGRLLVTMGDPATGAIVELTCGVGDTICTPPLTTLSYHNPGPAEVRVLFICTPPYATDDADTQSLPAHRPLTQDELTAAANRLAVVRSEIDARLAALTAQLVTLTHAIIQE